MIEELVKELIEALNRNTEAHSGQATLMTDTQAEIVVAKVDDPPKAKSKAKKPVGSKDKPDDADVLEKQAELRKMTTELLNTHGDEHRETLVGMIKAQGGVKIENLDADGCDKLAIEIVKFGAELSAKADDGGDDGEDTL